MQNKYTLFICLFLISNLAIAAPLPNDPNFPQQWDFHNTGQTGGNFDADIDAPEAWELIAGMSPGPVIVAVIDTGVDYTHPDLAGRMWVNADEIPGNGVDDDENGYVDDIHVWNFTHDNNDILDSDGHGTHVAGTIAAATDNEIGVAGIADNAEIMVVRFLDEPYTPDFIEAINYAVNNGAKVINSSWGDANEYDEDLFNAIESAAQAGVIFVAAAGDDGNDNDTTSHYPSDYDCSNIISVAASDHYDNLTNFSNYGARSVDIAAPGDEIFSTVPLSLGDGSGYDTWSGTSMATAHVSGAAAMLYALGHEMIADIKGRIMLGGDYVSSIEEKILSRSRLNLYGAVTLDIGVFVNSPGGGENWQRSKDNTIEWASFGGTGVIDIKLFKGGNFYIDIATDIPESIGDYNWQIPSNLPLGSDYRILIDDGIATGQSLADFSIIESTDIDCHYILAGDMNRDCKVDFADFANFASNWLIDCNLDPQNPACLPDDLDNDGYYASVDCNDSDPNINPGQPEICGDGIDNNCDSQIDEGCP